jgi:hypothetical protein
MDTRRQSRREASSTRSGRTPSAGESGARAPDRARLVMWRRRHVNVRTGVALIALTSLVLPGVAAIIAALL